MAIGVCLALPLVISYLQNDYRLDATERDIQHLAVTGMALAISGVQLFVFTLLLHGTVAATTSPRPRTAARERNGEGNR